MKKGIRMLPDVRTADAKMCSVMLKCALTRLACSIKLQVTGNHMLCHGQTW